jgi:hypothetical protein
VGTLVALGVAAVTAGAEVADVAVEEGVEVEEDVEEQVDAEVEEAGEPFDLPECIMYVIIYPGLVCYVFRTEYSTRRMKGTSHIKCEWVLPKKSIIIMLVYHLG